MHPNQKNINKDHRLTFSWLHKRILIILTRWADILQHKSNQLSQPTLQILAVTFFLVASSVSVLVATNSLHRERESIILFAPIRFPHNITKTGDEKTTVPNYLNDTEMIRLIGLINNLESLKNNSETTELYNRIVNQRPGLIDSLKEVIQMYNK